MKLGLAGFTSSVNRYYLSWLIQLVPTFIGGNICINVLLLVYPHRVAGLAELELGGFFHSYNRIASTEQGLGVDMGPINWCINPAAQDGCHGIHRGNLMVMNFIQHNQRYMYGGEVP